MQEIFLLYVDEKVFQTSILCGYFVAHPTSYLSNFGSINNLNKNKLQNINIL